MGIEVDIAGIDRTAQSRFESLRVVNTIAANADVAELSLLLQPGSTWRPQAGNELVVKNGTSREFGGLIMRVRERATRGAQLRYVCQAKDYLHLLNKKLVVTEYTVSTLASTIVSDVVNASTDGFSSTGIAAAPLVAARKIDYVASGDVVRSLAAEVGYAWWIDYNKVVYFVSAASMVAPVAAINLDTDITNYGDFDIDEAVDAVKTRVFVKDWKQKSDVLYNNSFLGDGTSKFFLYGQEPSAIADMSATINGVALSIGTDNIDSQPGSTIGSSSGIYVCFDNLGIRFGSYAPSSTETVVVSSNYMVPGFITVEDSAAQAAAAAREGGDGIHEYAVSNPGLTASDGSDTLALTIGNAVLARDAYARLTARFSSFTQGWRAGQTFQVTSSKRMGGSFSETFNVVQVTKKLVNHPSGGSPLLHYEIEAMDGVLVQ